MKINGKRTCMIYFRFIIPMNSIFIAARIAKIYRVNINLNDD